MTALPCPSCGSELAFLEQYRRHYCYACGRYASDGYGDGGAKICPTCGGILSYVAQYDRYYCYRCNAYPAEGAVLAPKAEPAASSPNSTGSASPAVFVVEPPSLQAVARTAVEVPLATEPEQQKLVEEEIPVEETVSPRARPPLDRDEVQQAKKPLLMDLCKAYDMDPTGTKEQLRERLLSYLDELEAENRPREVAQEVEEQPEQLRVDTEVPSERENVVREPESSWARAAEEPRPSEPVPSLGPSVAPAVVVERPPPQSFEPSLAPILVSVPEPEAIGPEAPAPAGEASTVLHPCPTCGRELTNVAQYKRWYCYSCRRYAPRAISKFACPNCGAGLRWIHQYERWWCDSCRRYAPADLPWPERAATAATAPAKAARTVATPAPFAGAAIAHRHRSPVSGIGLVGFGVVLFVVYEILADLPAVLSYTTGVLVAPDVAFGLRFFAFLFVAVGAILGLMAVRDRP